MPTYTFLPGAANFNEVQALYTGLFDAPQSSNSGGLLYWENYLASNNAGALNAISGYATYNGQTLSSSNIGSEINNIYEHLLGAPASSSGNAYWASQWTGDGGTMSIGQIADAIYKDVENIPTTSSSYSTYTEKMDNKLLNYYNEAQALYAGLIGTMPTANALNYWENYLASDNAGALNAISGYVTYNNQALSSSNIGNEINNIYEHLLGVPASSGGISYWSSQWTGDGGTMSIGQIVGAIYNFVESSSASNSYYQYMNTKIDSANISVSLSDALTAATIDSYPQSYTMPTTFSTGMPSYSSSGQSTSYEYVYAFPSSTTQSDTLIFTASPNYNTVTDVNGNSYYGAVSYAFTGDASGHNTVDVSYQASGSNLIYYLTNASNFQTLDFNYSGGNSNYNSVTLDIAQINSGFVNFIFDNTGFNNSFTFNNAVNNDTFIVQSSIDSLSINEATGNTSANVIMDGVNIFSDLNHYGQSLNIDSTGSIGNYIDEITFTESTTNGYILNNTSPILNISGSESLTVGGVTGYGSNLGGVYSGISLLDGSTLSINDNSAAGLTIYVGDNNSNSTNAGITINLSYSSAPITLYDVSSNFPDNITLGSGTDTIYTNGGNSIITVGSGANTVVVNSNVDSSSLTSNSYSGYITTIEGNNSNYSADSVVFTNGMPSSVYINPSFSNETSNVSSATSESQGIAIALNTLNNAHSTTTTGDYSAYFQYGGNTYIINDYVYPAIFWSINDQVVKLIGDVNLSNVTISGHTISNL